MARRILMFLAVLVGSACAVPAGASAATLTGLTTLSLDGTAAGKLTKAKVTTTASSPAQLAGGRLILPAASGTVATSTKVDHVGTLTLRRTVKGKKRVLTVKGLRLELGSKTRTVTGVFDGRRRTFLQLDLRKGEYSTVASSSSVQITSTRASLSKDAAKAIAAKLALKGFKPGLYGVLGTNVGQSAGGSSAVGGTGTGGSSSGSAGGTGTGTGTGSGGGSTSTPAPNANTFPDPGTLARPASAVDVTASSFTWRVRESFVRYINTEGAPTVSDGATPGAPKVVAPAGVPLIYDYGFAPNGGWYDAASGKARLLFTGKVRFTYPSHGIDFDVINPEIELDGANSRVVATFGGRAATPYAGRTALIALKPSGLSPAVNGNTRTYASIPGTVPASASGGVFAGFYSANDPFGAISLEFAA